MASGEKLKKFGKYFLLDEIAGGGMAEIFRARDPSGRFLVIKRIQAGLGNNTEFVQMFESEIRVTMDLHHPNVVQLFESGKEEGQQYIAMEWVDGRNLRQIQTRLAELKKPFLVGLAAHIIEQAASGLHYAHVFKDPRNGTPLNIVHRDISPQNIIVTYEGNVKVIDFGIAKAATNSEHTKAGIIKGKLAYLSPEQITGEKLDGRCDQFALGIVLWELLTNQKLFRGENELAVLKQIEACGNIKPPSSLNPNVPKELEYIVLKALARSRDRRFASCEELQRALHKFLYAYNPDFNPSDLSYQVKDIFSDEIDKDRQKLQRLNEQAEKLLSFASDDPTTASFANDPDVPEIDPQGLAAALIPPKPEPHAGGHGLPPKRPEATVIALMPEESSQALEFERPAQRPQVSAVQTTRSHGSKPSTRYNVAQTRTQNGVASRRREESRKGPLLVAGIAAALLVGAPFLGFEVPIISDLVGGFVSSPHALLQLEGDAGNATVSINGEIKSQTLPAALKDLPVGTALRVSVQGPQGTFEQEVILKKGEKRLLRVSFAPEQTSETPIGSLQPATMDEKAVVLKLNIYPGASRTVASLNGKPISPTSPSIVVRLDEPLELIADQPGFAQRKIDFVLSSTEYAGRREITKDVQLEPLNFGYLTVRSTPSADAKITHEGDTWVRKTPLELEKVPAGTYSILIENVNLGLEKQVDVVVEPNKTAKIDVQLSPKQEFRAPAGNR